MNVDILSSSNQFFAGSGTTHGIPLPHNGAIIPYLPLPVKPFFEIILIF
jgi:hypothetical protein